MLWVKFWILFITVLAIIFIVIVGLLEMLQSAYQYKKDRRYSK